MGEKSLGDRGPQTGTKRKRREVTLGIREFIDWFGEDKINENEEVVLHIRAKDGDTPMRRKNQFLLAKHIKEVTDKIVKASFNAEEDLILRVKNETEANKLLKISKLGRWEIKVEKHKTLNSSKGVIFNPNLCYLSEEEILEGLIEYKAKEVYIFKRTPRDSNGTNEPKPYGLMTVTFDTREPPKRVKYGFEYIEVRKYVPNPKRCRTCQKLGHTTKWCKSQQVICELCGDEKIENHICSTLRCVNCSRPGHASNSRECPTYLMHKEWEYIMVHENLSKYEARKLFFSRYKDLDGFLQNKDKNLAEIVRGSPNQTDKQQTDTTAKLSKDTPTANPNTKQKEREKSPVISKTRSKPATNQDNTSKTTEGQQEDVDMEANATASSSENNTTNNTNIKVSSLKLREWKSTNEGVTYLLDNNIQQNLKPKLDFSKIKKTAKETNKKFLDHANKILNEEDLMKAIMEEVKKHKGCKKVRVQTSKQGATIETISDDEEDGTLERMTVSDDNL